MMGDLGCAIDSPDFFLDPSDVFRVFLYSAPHFPNLYI